MTPDNRSPPPANPYAAPQSRVLAEAVQSENPAIAQFRAFVGPRADVYCAKWYHLIMGGTGSAGFNWPAFLFSGFWIPFRKMYRVTALFYGAILTTTIGEEVLFVHLLGRPETPPLLDHAVNLAFSLVCGFGGNRWYLSYARRVIAEVHAIGLPESECMDEISRRGGTSMLASVGLFVCFCVAMIGLLMFLEFLNSVLRTTP